MSGYRTRLDGSRGSEPVKSLHIGISNWISGARPAYPAAIRGGCDQEQRRAPWVLVTRITKSAAKGRLMDANSRAWVRGGRDVGPIHPVGEAALPGSLLRGRST